MIAGAHRALAASRVPAPVAGAKKAVMALIASSPCVLVASLQTKPIQ